MMDPADRMLLAECRASLNVPFRAPVRVGGVLVPRALARRIERALARLNVIERNTARTDAMAQGRGGENVHHGRVI